MRVLGADWDLAVNYAEKRFSGRVGLTVEKAPAPLELSASSLEIESVAVDGRSVPFALDGTRGLLVISNPPGGGHHVEIAYRGAVDTNALVGFYTAPCGPGYALTTMLFPTGSGRLLPSFEHPSVKTVYRLRLTVDPGVEVVFNTAPHSEREVEGHREIVFEPTPQISAYLLYLGVGPFDSLSINGSARTVRVLASPGRASAGRYCAERGAELLAEYEAYYGLPYPLSKLDLVGLENFWAGAMENWGAITFRENLLLVDPTTSVLDRRAILAVLAHEIAHQWFGDLVTPRDWEDFWLNESFATFVGYRIVGRRYSARESNAYFLNRWFAPALEQDSLTSTHPVRMPVPTPEALGEVSDEVTYGKGAAILRMFEAYVGEETFRRAVARYLDQHQYANARAEDLWAAIDEVTGRPVARLVNEWISRPGYPVVKVGWAAGTLTLRQSRFLADGTESKGTWPVPLRVRTAAGDSSLLLDQAEAEVRLPSIEGLRVDPGRTAFVRLRYDAGLFRAMVAAFPTMDPIDQWGLIADAKAFLYSGAVPLDGFLALLDAGVGLSEELPIQALTLAILETNRCLFDVPSFLASARRFLAAQVERVGLDPRPGEPSFHALLREMLADARAMVDPAFARELAPRFGQFDELPGELRKPVAIALGRVGGEEGFRRLLNRLETTSQESERIAMTGGLGSFPDAGLQTRALDLVFGTRLTPATAFALLVSTAANPDAGLALFRWLQAHVAEVVKMWAGTPLLSLLLRGGLVTMGIRGGDEVLAYLRAHTPPEAAQGVAQGLESLRLASRLRERVRAS